MKKALSFLLVLCVLMSALAMSAMAETVITQFGTMKDGNYDYQTAGDAFTTVDDAEAVEDGTLVFEGKNWLPKLGESQRDYKETMYVSIQGGDIATYTQDCTGLAIGMRCGPGAGICVIKVDGQPINENGGRYDCYRSSLQRGTVVYAVEGLTPGAHTVTIEVTGEKNGSANNYSIMLDYLQYIPLTAEEEAALEINEKMALEVSSSEAVVGTDDDGDFNITWNAKVAWGEEITLEEINEAVNFTGYGVYYGVSETDVQALADGDTTVTAAKQRVIAEGDNIDVYTIFGFRLKNVTEGRNRAAMFYITYELGGRSYTVYSDCVDATAVAAQ